MIHECCNPGLTMGNVSVVEIKSVHGQSYWKATEPIGSIFGQEVHGEIWAIGPTKEECLHRLGVKRKNLYDSLWA